MSSSLAVDQLRSGNANAGSDCGIPPKREPMVSTCRPNSAVNTVAATSAMIVPGRCELRRLSLPQGPDGACGMV